MITGQSLTAGQPSLESDDRPDRPHWETTDAHLRGILDAEVAEAAKRVRRAATQRRLERAQAALEALPSLIVATLLRESREGLDAAVETGDVGAWEWHAMATVTLMRECERRRGNTDHRYIAWLDQVEAALDAGVLGQSMEFPNYPRTRNR